MRNWAGYPSSVSPKWLSTHLYSQETYPHRLGPSTFVLCHPPGLAKAEHKQETREMWRERSCDLPLYLPSMVQVALTLWRQGPSWGSWILWKLPALPHPRLGGKSEQQELTWASHFLAVSLNPDSIPPIILLLNSASIFQFETAICFQLRPWPTHRVSFPGEDRWLHSSGKQSLSKCSINEEAKLV